MSDTGQERDEPNQPSADFDLGSPPGATQEVKERLRKQRLAIEEAMIVRLW